MQLLGSRANYIYGLIVVFVFATALRISAANSYTDNLSNSLYVNIYRLC